MITKNIKNSTCLLNQFKLFRGSPHNHLDRIQAASQPVLYGVMHFAVSVRYLGAQKRPVVFIHVFHQINVHFFSDQSDHICEFVNEFVENFVESFVKSLESKWAMYDV